MHYLEFSNLPAAKAAEHLDAFLNLALKDTRVKYLIVSSKNAGRVSFVTRLVFRNGDSLSGILSLQKVSNLLYREPAECEQRAQQNAQREQEAENAQKKSVNKFKARVEKYGVSIHEVDKMVIDLIHGAFFRFDKKEYEFLAACYSDEHGRLHYGKYLKERNAFLNTN